jgi:hypothetical protein
VGDWHHLGYCRSTGLRENTGETSAGGIGVVSSVALSFLALTLEYLTFSCQCKECKVQVSKLGGGVVARFNFFFYTFSCRVHNVQGTCRASWRLMQAGMDASHASFFTFWILTWVSTRTCCLCSLRELPGVVVCVPGNAEKWARESACWSWCRQVARACLEKHP